MPRREMRSGGRPAMSAPPNRMRPLVGRRTPVRQLKNVLLPAPLGPMIARISPRGTAKLTLFSAVRPPKRTVNPSVRSIASKDSPPRLPAATGADVVSERNSTGPFARSAGLGELAGRRQDGLVLRDDLQESVLVVLDVEDELAEEGLVVLLPQGLVALREVGALLDVHSFQGLDELHGVLAPAEAGLLHAELEEVHRFVVGLHVPIWQRARGVDLLEPRARVVEELLVSGRVERRVHHGDVPVDAHEAFD